MNPLVSSGKSFYPRTPLESSDYVEPLPRQAAFIIPSPAGRSHKVINHDFFYQVPKLLKDNAGLGLICLSQLFGSCMSASVQLLNRLNPPVPPAEILRFRKYSGVPDPLLGPPEVRPLLIIRGISGMIGVILIARPKALFGDISSPDTTEHPVESQRMLAVGIAMLGVLGATGAYVSLRAIGKRAHVLHNMNYFAFFSGFIAFLL
ncbi:hypothetical protein Clacol_008445 [Clathrus columnatus]|uniref:Uncharacterized protein n=1 Tax=Clathrus columnatus TaxID=1419009 RepID=A0AAV5AM77_9AGAM|nr:hypothetical protein Clacol_008445 [Clathrus columnatus]